MQMHHSSEPKDLINIIQKMPVNMYILSCSLRLELTSLLVHSFTLSCVILGQIQHLTSLYCIYYSFQISVSFAEADMLESPKPLLKFRVDLAN